MAASYQQLAQPPNLMNLYMQMAQRQAASDQINRGFALIAANHAGSPWMARAIMESATGGGMDAGQTMNNLLTLYGRQQQMQGQQQMMGQADAIAAKLGMTPDMVRGEILAGYGPDLVRSMMPTEKERDIRLAHDQFINAGGTEQDWNKNILPQVMLSGIPGMTPEYMSYAAEKRDWINSHTGANGQLTEPVPDRLSNVDRWRADINQSTALHGEKQSEINQAVQNQPMLTGDLEDMRTKIDAVQKAYDDGKLDRLLQLPEGGIHQLASGEVGRLTGWLNYMGAGGLAKLFGVQPPTDEEINLAKKIDGLVNTDTKHWGTTATKHLNPQMQLVGSKLGGLSSFAGKDQFGANLGGLNNAVLDSEANVYGAANITPPTPDLERRVSDIYLPGGEMNLRNTTPIPADELQQAITEIKAGRMTRAGALKHFKANYHDTSALETALNQAGA
jgi:hypothetical protein